MTNDVSLKHGLGGKTLVAKVAPDFVIVHMISFVLSYVVHTSRRELAEPALVGAVFMLALDVVLTAVLCAEELVTGFAAVSYAVLASARMILGHVHHTELNGGEDLIAPTTLEEPFQGARLCTNEKTANRLGVACRTFRVLVFTVVVIVVIIVDLRGV